MGERPRSPLPHAHHLPRRALERPYYERLGFRYLTNDQETPRLRAIRASPARETSRQTIRSRVLGNHLNGNVGSSTFRFVLAALLIDALDVHPYVRRAKVALSAYDNGRLSRWQHKHLLLTWCVRERPWEIEGRVIAQLRPPLNAAGNAAHTSTQLCVLRAPSSGYKRLLPPQHCPEPC